ncbi:MAG: transposase [Hyphomicrobiaceae bacterium]
MLTRMTDEDWDLVVDIFQKVRSKRGAKGKNDRRFLEALHYFTVHNLTWRALPAEFGNWNSVWRRFSRLSDAGTFEAFFQALAACSRSAGLLQMFDSTSTRAHVSAAGAKGGSHHAAVLRWPTCGKRTRPSWWDRNRKYRLIRGPPPERKVPQ